MSGKSFVVGNCICNNGGKAGEVSYQKESGTAGEPDRRRADAVDDSLAAPMGEYGKKGAEKAAGVLKVSLLPTGQRTILFDKENAREYNEHGGRARKPNVLLN